MPYPPPGPNPGSNPCLSYLSFTGRVGSLALASPRNPRDWERAFRGRNSHVGCSVADRFRVGARQTRRQLCADCRLFRKTPARPWPPQGRRKRHSLRQKPMCSAGQQTGGGAAGGVEADMVLAGTGFCEGWGRW